MQTDFSEDQLKDKDNKSTENYKKVFIAECVMQLVQPIIFWVTN